MQGKRDKVGYAVTNADIGDVAAMCAIRPQSSQRATEFIDRMEFAPKDMLVRVAYDSSGREGIVGYAVYKNIGSTWRTLG